MQGSNRFRCPITAKDGIWVWCKNAWCPCYLQADWNAVWQGWKTDSLWERCRTYPVLWWKARIQAIATTGEDHPPIPNTDKSNGYQRDYEYVRLGTLSLLAAIDLLSGEAIPLVSETHKSSDFVTFLKKLDEKYPKSDMIRIILDNHSAHTSKETQNIWIRFLDVLSLYLHPNMVPG